MVSIIIPIHNEEKYLDKCLKSIQKQNITDFEVICVNDGSSDNSEDIIKNYCEYDKRFILKKSNFCRAGEARNYGVTYARGEYILFFDADDIMLDNLLESALCCFKKTNADVVIWNVREFGKDYINNDTCHLKKEFFYHKETVENKKYIFNFTSGATWNKMYRREFWLNNFLKFKNTKCFNDIYVTYSSLLKAQIIGVIEEQLTLYRVDSENSLQDKREKYLKDLFDNLNYLSLEIKNERKEVQISYKNYCLSLLMSLIKTCRTIKGIIELFDYTISYHDLVTLNETEVFSFYKEDFYLYEKIRNNSYLNYLEERFIR